MQKALLERILKGEMTDHMEYEKSDTKGYNTGNSRNGSTKKILKGEFGEIELATPRDRNNDFEPQFIKKRQTRYDGFDKKIVSMYARGLSTRDIQGQLKEMYDVDVYRN